MIEHIRELHIQDYKGIHDLKISNLKRVNILTGDNNSGKTSVLELISTLNDPASLNCWVSGARIRPMTLGDGAIFEGIVNLFPVNMDEKKISFSLTDEAGRNTALEMTGELIEDQLTEDELQRINGYARIGHRKTDDSPAQYRTMQGIHLVIKKNDEFLSEVSFYEEQYRMPRRAAGKNQRIIYVSPVAHEENNRYIDELLKTKKTYDSLVQLLKIFDPDVVGINALRNGEALRSVNYYVLTSRQEKALPLSSYGDGMKKAVLLLSSLVRSENGILLVDEFETGIHTSGMDQVFDVLLQGAKMFNVQIFLTSHSREAISKVLRLRPEMQEEMNLYTLYRYDGKNLVRCMSASEAINAQEHLGLELR